MLWEKTKSNEIFFHFLRQTSSQRGSQTQWTAIPERGERQVAAAVMEMGRCVSPGRIVERLLEQVILNHALQEGYDFSGKGKGEPCSELKEQRQQGYRSVKIGGRCIQ